MIWAPEPWSGKIGLVDAVWAAAHTTQFTSIGWRYSRQGAGSGYLPATAAAAHHTIALANCSAPLAAAQRWRWRAEGAIVNSGDGGGGGGCLSTSGGGKLHAASCDGSAAQRFRKHATMQGHVESVAKPGACIDMNVQAGDALDLYACCVSPACRQENEEWSFGSTGEFTNADGQCVTVGAAAASGGSGSFVTLQSPDAKDFTVVIETMANGDSTCGYGNSGWDDIIVGQQPHRVSFCFEASACPTQPLVLFYSNFNRSVAFEKHSAPKLDGSCCVALALERNSLYTLSTVATARKGAYPIEAIVPVEGQAAGCGSVAKWTSGTAFPIPYSTAFSASSVGSMEKYFADMQVMTA